MKLFAALALSAGLAAQTLPPPSFPPITFNTPAYGGNCVGSQWASWISTDFQKTANYISSPPTFDVGKWVTHETWCESLPGGNYMAVLYIDAAPWNSTLGCLTPVANPINAMGPPFVFGYHHLFLNQAQVILTPTHALYQPFNTFYYVGYQIPQALFGYSVIFQWLRLDPNGGLYLSNMNGYTVLH